MPGDIFVHHHGPERQMCTGQPFRECHQIGFAGVTVSLPREPLAAATKAAHHFISDQEYAARTCKLTQSWPVIVWRDDAVRPGIGLHQNSRNRFCTFAVDFVSNGRDGTPGALDFVAATKWAPICVGWLDPRNRVTLRINLIMGT